MWMHATLLAALIHMTVPQETSDKKCQTDGVTCGDTDVDEIKRSLTAIATRLDQLESAFSATAGCPTDFTYVASVNGCYKLAQDLGNWTTSAMGCRLLNPKAHLATIDNESEKTAVAALLDTLKDDVFRPICDGRLWIAANRFDPSSASSSFVWRVRATDGSETYVRSMRFANWNDGEPNSYLGIVEACGIAMLQVGYRWNDVPCDLEYCSLCEVDMVV